MSIEARQQEAMSIATRAVELARQYRHEMVTLEHVLMALLETEEVQTCLNQLQVDIAEIGNTIQTFMTGDFIDKNDHGRPIKTIAFETLFVRAVASGLFSARKTVTAVDILLHMLQYPHEDNFAVSTLLRANLNSTMLKRFLSHGVAGATSSPMGTTPGMAAAGAEAGTAEPEPGSRDEAIKFIKKFATNLNEEALAGKIDPIIGRAVELDNTVQILARRTKNNLIYVGEPGTGKTACAEGLAYNITKGDVPTILKNATVWSLDIGNLVAGTRFRGDLEERMKIFLKCMTFLSEPLPESDPNSPAINILFIDEMHTVMEAGSGSKGSLDVANMLKPALAKGTLRCIGSTTYEEYRKHFEKDRALSRRFKKIQIDEPSPELTKKILRGLRGLYEAFHGVTYTDAALDAAVDLTHRYVHTALLPDKAIDIIDQAGSRQRITPEDQRLVIIDVEQIEAEVSKIAKIPAQNITETESDKLQRLESDLASKVFGQEKALTALNDAVIISRSGLREPNLPAGAYLLTGSSGVGKTESARQLAKTLGIPLIKFDMSEYMEKHAVSKLIGSPPGYVGFGDGAAGDGLLINAIENNQSCVLLLDEIEKAHEDLFNILLQVMDDAKLTSGSGKTVKFNNVYLLMTTNAGVIKTEAKAIGFGRVAESAEVDEKAIKRLFKPEFRNRLDAMIHFNPLQPEIMIKVVDKFIDNMNVLSALRNVTVDVSQAAKEWLATKGYDRVMGARPLTRVIDEHIKKPLSREMLFGSLKNGGTALVTLEDDALVLTGMAATVETGELVN